MPVDRFLSALDRVAPPQIATKARAVAERIGLSGAENVDQARASRMAMTAFAVRVASAVLLYASQILFARWMGTSEYGIFVVVWTWLTILSIVTGLGLNAGVVRMVPQYLATGQADLMRGLLIGGRVLAAGTSIAFALIGVGVLTLVSDPLTNPYLIPVYLGAICLPMFAITDVQDGLARGQNWTDLAFMPTYLWRPIALLVLMAGASFAGVEMTAVNAMICGIAAVAITCLAQMIRLQQRIRRDLPAGPRRYDYKGWVAVAIPILFVEGTLVVITGTDILVLSQFMAPHDVAVYFAALKTLALVHFVYFAIKSAFAHRFAHAFHSGNAVLLEHTVRTATRWCFWPSLVFAMMLAGVAPLLLSLFGPDFQAGYPLLLVLLVGVLARASIGPVDALLVMSGHQKTSAVIYSIILASNLGLNYILVPVHGLMGAAVATTLAMILEVGLVWYAARRLVGINVWVFARRPPLAGQPQPAE